MESRFMIEAVSGIRRLRNTSRQEEERQEHHDPHEQGQLARQDVGEVLAAGGDPADVDHQRGARLGLGDVRGAERLQQRRWSGGLGRGRRVEDRRPPPCRWG